MLYEGCYLSGDGGHVAFFRGVGLGEGDAVVQQGESVSGSVVVQQSDTCCGPCVGSECEEATSFDGTGCQGVHECFYRREDSPVARRGADSYGVVSEYIAQCG